MQTDLRNRDLIGDLDFSKEEVETVLDVAWDLKRKRALGEPHAYLRDKVLAMLFFFSSTRTRGSFEAGMAQLGGHGAFIDSKTTQISHGDTEREMGDIFGRYFDGIAIRHVTWGTGNRYLNLVAEASRVPVLNMQCEIYHPHPVSGRLDDHHGKERPRLAQAQDGSFLGLCIFILEAYFRTAIVDPANAALRYGRSAGTSAGIQADARYHGAGAGTGSQISHRL